MRSMNAKRGALPALAAFVLVVGIGCAPSRYELQYPVLVDENRKLEERRRALVQKSLELYDRVHELEERVKAADDALTAQERLKTEEEQQERALLERLRQAVKGTPSEAERRGDTYVVTTRFSFEPGRADLNAKAKADLKKIGKALTEGFPDATFLVAGHADASPIRESKFDSNWQLSGERARSVMEFLVTECKIPEKTIGYAGFGEFRPVADDSTPEGRARNRRVEIVVNP